MKVMIPGGLTAAIANSAAIRIGHRPQGHHSLRTFDGNDRECDPCPYARGESVDVLIMVVTALDNLIKEGKATADSKVDLVLSPIGMVVQAGAPKPDIGSGEVLK
jgi:molybdate transport system substrate-binding protein